jgi:hypothetical protein
MFGFRSRSKTEEANSGETDDQAWSAIRSNNPIRTTKVIKGFAKVSDSDLEKAKKVTQQRQKDSKNFQALLGENLKQQEIDVADTKAHQGYLAESGKRAIEMKGALAAKAIALDTLRVPLAQMQAQQTSAKRSVDAKVAEILQKANQIAGKKGGRQS